MRWHKADSRFVLQVHSETPDVAFALASCRKLGNELTHPELAKVVNGGR